MEKISIVIPAYNAEKTIEQAVASALIQNVPKEIIIVDDGSADSTPQILSRLAEEHPEIRVIRQPNAGVSAARNAGIEAAAGKWLMTLDDDDYMDVGMLESMAKAVKKENCDLAICGMKLKYEDRTESYSEPALTADRSEFLNRKMTALYDRHLLTTHSNKLYDLDLIRRENLGYRGELQINEDIDFVFRYLAKTSRITLLEEPYLNYVQHSAGGSLITTFRKNGISSSLLLVKDLEELYPFLNEETKAGMDRRMLVHILSCAGQMYYRSDMDDVSVRKEIADLAGDETFRRLLARTKPGDFKTFAAKILLSARMAGVYHRISRRMYRGYR